MPDSRSAKPRSSEPARKARPRREGRRPQREHARPFKPFTPEQLAERAAAIPVISYPDLPVSARRDEIARAIRDHQVVIVSGETGSGKTTQLPKICMQLGRGVAGMIGHTQPRRLAARSVADRIADELGQTVGRERGQVVGYQVRFTDEVGPTTLVKLMTDGILLAEIQSDPMLRRYDTLIIDEAHERSLNIDFILGYVARLLPARPDLKVIITSATIDSDRFARHFGTWEGTPGSGRLIEPAPVIEVSGRTYPVEIRYRPLGPTTPSSYTSEASGKQADETIETLEITDVTESGPMQLVLEDPDDELATLGYGMGEDIDVETAICHAVDELSAEGDGDILVFLPGERDIRDTEAALLDHLKGRGRRAGDDKGARPGDIEILPLYARLTAAEQHRVFEPHRLRRVVLATNVAETSLTVPGIRYVIDPGLARISRYSNKTKVQRLPIEPVSQASANQRAGRCGRVAEGVAIRLFSQADYLSRPRFTEPEILRTSLASVILQMASLGLGAVEDFPFLDAPDRRAVRDGVALLVEIGALAQDREGADAAPASSQYRLTGIGRDLARLPIDPRLGRMLLEAERLGCASEVLVIVAALSIQDVRERPAEHQGTADASHARLADPHSDFITYLNLWRYLAVQARDLSGSAFRRMCRAEFFHYLRWREWRDVVGQLRQMARALGIAAGPVGEPSTGDVVEAAQFGGAQDAAVRAVLAYGQGTASVDADQVHRSLLVGLLSYLGSWDETKRDYEGARGTHFTIWPGSGVSGHPAWVMTAELVETSRLFARTVARIRPEWVEPAARGLLKRSYSEPFWSVAKGAAMVRERVTLYGLTLAADREVLLGRLGDLVIDEAVATSRSQAPRAGSLEALAAGLVSASKDPLSSGSFEPRHFEELAAAREGTTARELAREMFIRNALVDGQWRERHGFQRRNEALVEQAREVERRSRTHGLVADEQARFRFFDDLIPEHLTSAAAFNRWWKDERREKPDLLIYPASLLMPLEATSGEGFPDRWQCGELSLPLSYEFAPGSPRDGVSMRIPIEVLERVSDAGTDWLVPGMREDLLTEAIRALPKGVRRLLAPAPDVAASVARWIEQAGDEPVEAVVAPADTSAGSGEGRRLRRARSAEPGRRDGPTGGVGRDLGSTLDAQFPREGTEEGGAKGGSCGGIRPAGRACHRGPQAPPPHRGPRPGGPRPRGARPARCGPERGGPCARARPPARSPAHDLRRHRLVRVAGEGTLQVGQVLARAQLLTRRVGDDEGHAQVIGQVGARVRKVRLAQVHTAQDAHRVGEGLQDGALGEGAGLGGLGGRRALLGGFRRRSLLLRRLLRCLRGGIARRESTRGRAPRGRQSAHRGVQAQRIGLVGAVGLRRFSGGRVRWRHHGLDRLVARLLDPARHRRGHVRRRGQQAAHTLGQSADRLGQQVLAHAGHQPVRARIADALEHLDRDAHRHAVARAARGELVTQGQRQLAALPTIREALARRRLERHQQGRRVNQQIRLLPALVLPPAVERRRAGQVLGDQVVEETEARLLVRDEAVGAATALNLASLLHQGLVSALETVSLPPLAIHQGVANEHLAGQLARRRPLARGRQLLEMTRLKGPRRQGILRRRH